MGLGPTALQKSSRQGVPRKNLNAAVPWPSEARIRSTQGSGFFKSPLRRPFFPSYLKYRMKIRALLERLSPNPGITTLETCAIHQFCFLQWPYDWFIRVLCVA